ncbi:MAG TPA: hypothetical protein VFC26_11615, partial [Verrucomicrobiae bacterium]|nr:hypothetical protein [Verrucomicrobiae bacterium]
MSRESEIQPQKELGSLCHIARACHLSVHEQLTYRAGADLSPEPDVIVAPGLAQNQQCQFAEMV